MFRSFLLLAALATGYSSLYAQTRAERIGWAEQTVLPVIQISDSIYRPQTIEARMREYGVHALSLAVIRDYKVEWAQAYGWADTATRRRVTSSTLFLAGSISKSVNALGVLKLADEGRLDLHRDINEYLRSWTFPEDSFTRERKITTAHLLSHWAGLGVHGFPGYPPGAPLPTTVQILDGQQPANTPAVRSLFAPGRQVRYSGGGTTITQLLVSDLTGRPYDAYMEDAVLRPLRMKRSTFQQPLRPGAYTDRATAYTAAGKPVPGRFHLYPEMAAAGLWTNPTELARFIIDLQRTAAGKKGNVLSEGMARYMLTPFADSNTGLGVFFHREGGQTYFSHGGADAGFQALYFGSLEGGNGAVVMVNSDNGAILGEVMNSICTAYGWPVLRPVIKRKTVRLPADTLLALTGTYRFPDGDAAEVFVEEGQPYFRLRGRHAARMYFTDSRSFFCFSYPYGFSFAGRAGAAPDELHIRAGSLYIGRRQP
ncbi:MAG TPA: serine hydrolase domain-containing protein [Chitinophagaceae bacterium]|jgi:CubicO group peptidase (beta-lactamase class C family)|nr:serine hydrolase domain-containing protein [Chitinophagaceae bacterium]